MTKGGDVVSKRKLKIGDVELTPREIEVGWVVMERVDKIEIASSYLTNYCNLVRTAFTDEEWWQMCIELSNIYRELFNSGGNDSMWKTACKQFVSRYKKGEIK